MKIDIQAGDDTVSRNNVYIGMDGALHPMPFPTEHEGIWWYDGQVFYLRIHSI